jgi:cytochrome bd-type quinol oxidase subunit 1
MTQSAITLPTGTPAPKALEATKAAPTTAPTTEQTPIKYAFWLAAIGFVITIVLAGAVAWFTLDKFKDMTGYASAVSTVVTPFLTLLGTLVGTFFGVQVGASGKAELAQQVTEANKNAADANNKATAFASVADPAKQNEAISAYKSLTADGWGAVAPGTK